MSKSIIQLTIDFKISFAADVLKSLNSSLLRKKGECYETKKMRKNDGLND